MKNIQSSGWSAWRHPDWRKIGWLSAIVLLALVLSNYLVQRNYNRLDQQISSIYQDRLMPSHFLFRLQSLLLRKKLIQEHGELQKEQPRKEITRLDTEMDSIILAYEKTYLTDEEEKEWAVFKLAREEYEHLESELIQDHTSDNTSEAAQHMDNRFQQALLSLTKLNNLQTHEGSLIRESSRALISGSLLQSYIQISLVIVLMAIGIAIVLSMPTGGRGREMYN